LPYYNFSAPAGFI